jgi:hypothetical protein
MADDGKGLDWKHPGGKEALVAGGVALGLALIYFWWKNRQSQQAAANQQASTANSPTAVLMSWIHDHQSSSTSTGATVAVPNVVGMDDPDADAAIASAGLKVKDANEPKGGFGKNQTKVKVASQFPAANTKVAPGSTVTLTFSGPGT